MISCFFPYTRFTWIHVGYLSLVVWLTVECPSSRNHLNKKKCLAKMTMKWGLFLSGRSQAVEELGMVLGFGFLEKPILVIWVFFLFLRRAIQQGCRSFGHFTGNPDQTFQYVYKKKKIKVQNIKKLFLIFFSMKLSQTKSDPVSADNTLFYESVCRKNRPCGSGSTTLQNFKKACDEMRKWDPTKCTIHSK